MSKRRGATSPPLYPSPKRFRTSRSDHADQISTLSDELLLQILSFLPMPSLLICQRVSRRFHDLAGDSELWKKQYYSRWVRPRARRLANARRDPPPQSEVKYSPKVSSWLGHGHLAKKGMGTNWKRQYRLRHNWAKGACRVTEIEFPQPPCRQMLVTFCAGILFTVDLDNGLRVWSAEKPENCLAMISLAHPRSSILPAPTAMTATSDSQRSLVDVAVGFEDGRFDVYSLDTVTLRLDMRFSCLERASGAITAMASYSPYILLVSQQKVLYLYKITTDTNDTAGLLTSDSTLLLTSLKADNILEPISLSIRTAGSEIMASIVYSFYHIGCGWSLGIQALHFDLVGQQIGSRVTTTVDCHYGVDLGSPNRSSGKCGTASWATDASTEPYTRPADPSILHHNPPTSVSYSHPYLLTSHADNTLTIYLVVSTSTSLFVKGCRRLWGHTSAVSAVQVNDRGKAISVSSRGDEIRIWELESLASSLRGQKAVQDGNGIRISPEVRRSGRQDTIKLALSFQDISPARSRFFEVPHALGTMRGCIGFDDERVLLRREKEAGTQMLECYDFT
ncbi:F-box domain protein [Aspergillus heteromorphus CBS 117.55]|uniref:Probable E3 ubiquitin ligase complex SCF subunit sconB n=1 Tax=Aspergillus heteromorphus CBS 117.55 TaxID=1448321 RepID=A0A317UV91_9EURO|nr:F-box domain protein [Aspergillus heteromorphus CBS 117.55]PWY65346.1 F-box domain protein [Aspergillus heteromorphus CBS 117.55]